MKEYHKIQTVYERDPATKHRTLIDGQFACSAFRFLQDNDWEFTEKIDGTNIRVHCDGSKVRFGGRTSNAQIPTFLYDKLQEMFGDNGALRQLGDDVTLYGEGYGAKIQKGGDYIPDGVDFILFDVRIGDWWLSRNDAYDVADKLGVRPVPHLGHGTLSRAVHMAKAGFQSEIGTALAEGLVMRPGAELFERNGKRVIAKIKCKDFAGTRCGEPMTNQCEHGQLARVCIACELLSENKRLREAARFAESLYCAHCEASFGRRECVSKKSRHAKYLALTEPTSWGADYRE